MIFVVIDYLSNQLYFMMFLFSFYLKKVETIIIHSHVNFHHLNVTLLNTVINLTYYYHLYYNFFTIHTFFIDQIVHLLYQMVKS
jgi:hypothetical protein